MGSEATPRRRRASGIHARLWRSVHRRLFRPRAGSAQRVRALVSGKRGLEIGGPSRIFRRKGLLPIYGYAASIDGANFASQTIWEGNVQGGPGYVTEAGGPEGHQYIAEATDLAEIATGAYEFVASSHCLEHVANPVKALREWQRVTCDGAPFIIVLPHHRDTFDRRRPVTTLDHLVQDFEQDVGEDDLSHLEEVLALHDHELEPVGGATALEERSRANRVNRCLHHHVFDCELVERLVRHVSLELLAIEHLKPMHIVAVARKPSGRSTRPG